MKDRVETLIWRLTGWVPADWSLRDNYAMQRYWAALAEARTELRYDTYDSRIRALRIIEEALR